MDLICCLYSWWKGFRSPSATLPLCFNCGFISTSGYGSSTGVFSWGCPGGLGFAPVRARCGRWCGCTQGGWQLGQQEIQCFRRVWQPVLANMLQYSCLENPLSDREAWQATVYRVAKSWTHLKWPWEHRHRSSFWPVVALSPEKAMEPTPVLLPGKSRGRRSLVGCGSWGR